MVVQWTFNPQKRVRFLSAAPTFNLMSNFIAPVCKWCGRDCGDIRGREFHERACDQNPDNKKE